MVVLEVERFVRRAILSIFSCSGSIIIYCEFIKTYFVIISETFQAKPPLPSHVAFSLEVVQIRHFCLQHHLE